MMNYSLISKALLGLALGCCISQLSRAQRMPVEPLTPVQPHLQLPQPSPSLEHSDWKSGVQLPASTTTQPASPSSGVAQVTIARPQPLYLLEGELIIAPDFSGIQPNDIEKLMVYRGKDAPRQWRNLATNGIIDITLKQKKKLKSRSLADLGKELGLSGPITYKLNDMPVADPSLRIAVEAIGETKVTRTDAVGGTTVVAISVRLPKPSPPHPPGTIMLRGMALN
ncbi:hypothetical protein [Hymenobacter crusticola]|uniref:TonB-dependent receptor plug domain-containing protein n=1 Tax=Hymenobacter crusticola TaxID=1770526 RepID=A0A243WK63_9BACT|nr:hypothetical protein [Hymenobacter crusticola]OUJ76273.1 hypothetical protein BXP70_03175 [Hymenobacter crusticola]